MYLDTYQDLATQIAIYPGKYTSSGIVYCTLKLNGEAGEVAEKVGKALRDHSGYINRQDLALELGDVLWYIANLAEELGYSLQKIAEMNIKKLESRKERGVLGGSGDNR